MSPACGDVSSTRGRSQRSLQPKPPILPHSSHGGILPLPCVLAASVQHSPGDSKCPRAHCAIA